jgi:hypothetical protein
MAHYFTIHSLESRCSTRNTFKIITGRLCLVVEPIDALRRLPRTERVQAREASLQLHSQSSFTPSIILSSHSWFYLSDSISHFPSSLFLVAFHSPTTHDNYMKLRFSSWRVYMYVVCMVCILCSLCFYFAYSLVNFLAIFSNSLGLSRSMVAMDSSNGV